MLQDAAAVCECGRNFGDQEPVGPTSRNTIQRPQDTSELLGISAVTRVRLVILLIVGSTHTPYSPPPKRPPPKPRHFLRCIGQGPCKRFEHVAHGNDWPGSDDAAPWTSLLRSCVMFAPSSVCQAHDLKFCHVTQAAGPCCEAGHEAARIPGAAGIV